MQVPYQKVLKTPKSKELFLNDAVNMRGNEVAKKHGISEGRVSQIKSENKEIIERKKAELISMLPSVVDTVRTDINTNKRLSQHIALDFKAVDKDLVALKTSLDKTNLNILKIASEDGVGIFAGNTIHIGDNNQHNYVIPPVIQAWIDAQSCNTYDQDGNLVDNTQAVDTQGDTVDNDKR